MKIEDHTKLITTAFGITLVFIGSIVMVGWIFDIEILKSLSPTWVTMKFTTALSFTLSGIFWFHFGFIWADGFHHQERKFLTAFTTFRNV